MQADVQPEIPSRNGNEKQRTLIQWVVLVLALALLAGTIGINLFVDHGRVEEHERDRLTTQARIIAMNMEQQLATANRALEGLLGDLSVWRDVFDRQTHVEYIRAIAKAMPGIRSIGIIDADGILLTSDQVGMLGMDLSHRNYFQTAKWHPNRQTLYISPPFQSMYSTDAVTMARTALGVRGEFKGVVYATLNIQYFQTLMGSVLYAPDMWDTAAHADGALFLRMPKANESFRVSLTQPDTFFTRHMQSGEAATVLTGKSPNSKYEQIVAQHTVNPVELHMDKPLIIAVGRRQEAVFRVWRRGALLQSALLLIISLVTVSGLYAYQRRQRAFDRKEAQASTALRDSEENYRLIVENTKDVVIKLDVNGTYTYINPAYTELFGVSLEDTIGENYWRDTIPEDRSKGDAFFKSLFQPPYAGTLSIETTTAQGLRHLQWTAHALLDERGNVQGVIGIGRDVTQHVAKMNVLEEQAWRDPLTGLANRRHFLNLGNAVFAQARRYEHALSLLTLDLDHFKSVNDTHGHKAGDLVLQKFAEIVINVIRNVDICGRVGGEEFAFLLPETDITAALAIAQRLHKAIRESKIMVSSGATIAFTASIGVAVLDDDTLTLDALLERADQALYQAKRDGRDRTSVNAGPG